MIADKLVGCGISRTVRQFAELFLIFSILLIITYFNSDLFKANKRGYIMNYPKRLRVTIAFLLIASLVSSLTCDQLQFGSVAKFSNLKAAAGNASTSTTPLIIRVGIITNLTGTQSYVSDIGALGLAIDRIVSEQLLPNVVFEYVRALELKGNCCPVILSANRIFETWDAHLA